MSRRDCGIDEILLNRSVFHLSDLLADEFVSDVFLSLGGRFPIA